MDKKKSEKERHIESFVNGLEGQLRNATRNWYMHWAANGGKTEYLPSRDEMTVEIDGNRIIVIVLPVGNTNADDGKKKVSTKDK